MVYRSEHHGPRSAQFGQSPQALFYRGDKAFANQDFKAAYDAYKVALDRAEKPSAVQFYHLALAELELDMIVDAVDHLRMVTDMEPNHPMAGVMLGEIFMRQNKFPEAVRDHGITSPVASGTIRYRIWF